MQAIARHVSARDFWKRILLDSLITDFAQLARGSFSSSVVCVLRVVRVLRVWFVLWSVICVFRVWFVLLDCLECLLCETECTVRLYDTPYLWLPVWVRVLTSSRASIHTRNLAHTSGLLSLACLSLAHLQYSRVALLVMQVACTHLLTCSWAALYLQAAIFNMPHQEVLPYFLIKKLAEYANCPFLAWVMWATSWTLWTTNRTT